MEMTNREAGGVTIVSFEGKLDTNTCPEAEAHIKDLLDRGIKKLLVDFKSLDFVSSAGLRVLMVASREIKGLSQSIGVCELSPIMQEIFEISRFSFVLDIFGTLDEARAALD